MKIIFFAVRLAIVVSVVTFFSGTAFAVRPPLLTDDAETIGKGKFELEFNGEYSHNSEGGVTEKETAIESALTYGITDKVDAVLTVPYKFIREKGEETLSSDGFSDLALEVKWRFYEAHEWALALRPRITFPTGNRDKDLGTGKPTYSIFLIATKECEPWQFHFNLGYLRNEHDTIAEPGADEVLDDMRDNLFFASVATQYKATEHLLLVGDVGIRTNQYKHPDTARVYILGGLVYEASELVDLDLGVKAGLTKTEPDYSILGGIKFKF